jgi:hypothetical protein
MKRFSYRGRFRYLVQRHGAKSIIGLGSVISLDTPRRLDLSMVMEAPAGTPSAPYTAYRLRLDSDSRWQLIEPLPTDQRALDAESQRLDAKLGALDNGSEPDLVKGCGILETRRHALEAQARARFDRLAASISMLYEHECDQAKTRYAARCEQLSLTWARRFSARSSASGARAMASRRE